MTLLLPGEAEYRSHFIENFARAPLMFQTSQGRAPIHFAAHQFEHAFYESTLRNGVKDAFSLVRAERMDDIAILLADRSVPRRAGWDAKARTHSHTRCVSIAVDEFVVVVRLGLTRAGYLRGTFVTCFVADNSIGKILASPEWDEAQCIQTLAGKSNGR